MVFSSNHTAVSQKHETWRETLKRFPNIQFNGSDARRIPAASNGRILSATMSPADISPPSPSSPISLLPAIEIDRLVLRRHLSVLYELLWAFCLMICEQHHISRVF